MGKTLEAHELRHANRSVFAHTTDIVPAEIDEHHVFGAFLLVAFQLFRQPHVLFLVAAARPRAGDGMRFNP